MLAGGLLKVAGVLRRFPIRVSSIIHGFVLVPSRSSRIALAATLRSVVLSHPPFAQG